MTVSVSTNKANYLGNAATTVWPYNFCMPSLSDAVVLYTDATGAQSTIPPAAYTLTGVGQPTAGGGGQGGNLTYPLSGAPIAAGTSLTLMRVVPYTQDASETNQGGMWPNVIESADDAIVMQVQQLAEMAGRTLQLNPADATPLPALPPAASRAGKWLYFDASGNPIAASTPGGTVVITAPMQPALAAASLVAAGEAMHLSVTFATMAALRANTIACTQCTIAGYYLGADGGEGQLWHNTADTTTADNGGTVIVDGLGQRWYRWRSGSRPSVRWFGARGDGTTNDTAAFNAALTACMVVYVPLHTTGGYLLNGTVTIGTGQWLVTESPDVCFLTNGSSSTGNPIRLTGYGDTPNPTSGISGGAKFDMGGALAGSTAIRFGTSSGVVWNVRMQGRFFFMNCFEAIGDEASAANYVVDFRIDDVFIRYTRGRQVYIRRSRGFMVFNDFYLDQSANPAAITFEGARFEDMIGLEFNRFDCAASGLSAAAYQAAAVALVVNGTGQGGLQNSYLVIRRLLVDSTDGNGCILQNLMNLEITNATFYANLGYGMQITGCTRVAMTNFLCEGAVGMTGASAGQHGVQLSGCDKVQIGNLTSESNTGDGVFVNNSTRVTVANWITNSNTNIGWAEAGTSNYVVKSNGLSIANGAGSLTQVGAGSSSANWVANAGVVRASDVGVLVV
jgi:hypothetical protein